MKYTLLALTALCTLSACSVSKEQQANYEKMSCAQIAKHIGKYEERRHKGNIDSSLAYIEEAFAKNKDVEHNAQIDSAVAEIETEYAEVHLDTLRVIHRKKNCRW